MGIKIPLSTGYASAAAIEFGIGFWLFTKPQTEKKRLSLVRLSTIFSLRNVVVPTAVESHIANGILSLAGARLRAVLFHY